MAKTFAQWQKQYPDAIQLKMTSNTFYGSKAIVELVYGPGKEAKILENKQVGTLKGVKAKFITSVMALQTK